MKLLARVIIKGLLLFALVNLGMGLLGSLNLGRVSAYNHLVPGRPRFPFGESPREAYNFSLFDLDAMFASHQVSAPKGADEFRILIIGDSGVWGTLLRPEETFTGQLNARDLRAPDGRRVRFYNLGYPTLSLTKDLIIIDHARRFQPDGVIWLVTLESMPREKQLSVPLVANNPHTTRALLTRYQLAHEPEALKPVTFWDRTLVGRRKELADWFRLQLYGLMWAATGIDQLYPGDYPRAQVDLDADASFHGWKAWEGDIDQYLEFDVLEAAARSQDGIPLLLINEPILISAGKNSEVRYNFYYPRWAYDRYRAELERRTGQIGIPYLDAWDLVPADEFTNSAIHRNPAGEVRMADLVQTFLGQTLEITKSGKK